MAEIERPTSNFDDLITHFHGHPDYLELTKRELALHSSKNQDYAKGGHPLGNFYRVSSMLSNYPDLDLADPTVVCLTYMMKQLDATLWMLNGHYEGKVEDVGKRLEDVYIYAKIARIIHANHKQSPIEQIGIQTERQTDLNGLVQDVNVALDKAEALTDEERKTLLKKCNSIILKYSVGKALVHAGEEVKGTNG